MPARVKLRVDFYEVETPEGTNFEQILAAVNSLPNNDASRNVDISGRPARLLTLTQSQNFFEGDLIRIRMDDLPKKASLVGNVENLDLEDDEGIGEETAFLYIKSLNVLVLQRNRSGVSASAFAKYFEAKAGLDGPIDLLSILAADALAKLGKFKEIRRFHIKVAGFNNIAGIPGGEDCGINELLELKDVFEAPFIDIAFSVGKLDQSLPKRLIKKAARLLYRHHSADQSGKIKKIEVIGHYDNGTRDLVDLIDYVIRCEYDVPVGAGRSISYAARRSALLNCWNQKRNEIATILRNPG